MQSSNTLTGTVVSARQVDHPAASAQLGTAWRRMQRFSTTLGACLLASAALSAPAYAGFGGGFGLGAGGDHEASSDEDTYDLDLTFHCTDRDEPSIWFDGRCRDEDWIVSTLANRIDRDFVVAYGSGLDDSGDAGILMLERASDTSGKLFLTTIVPYSLAPADSPNRSGYAITSEEHFETGIDAYGGLTVRSTQYSVSRETRPIGLFSTMDVWDWSVDADSTMTVAEPYALSGSGAPDGAPACADAAMMAKTQTRDWCEVNHVDAGDKWVKNGFVVFGVVGAGIGIVGGFSSLGLGAAPAAAIVAAGLGVMAGAETHYQNIVEDVCGEVASDAYKEVIDNCEDEPEEEPEIPTHEDDPPEVEEGELNCDDMGISQPIDITNESCSCTQMPDEFYWVDAAETDDPDEPGGEWVVVEGASVMECSTSTTTTWECCDPSARDCSPGELDGASNRDDISCD
jgi:hypothetical protein